MILLPRKNFYHRKLGLKLIFESALSQVYELKGSLLIFYASEKKHPVYHIAFNIPSNQINEARLWMQDKAELIAVDKNNYIADFSKWNAEALYFFDNNQNIIEFIARRNLENPSYSSFDKNSILSVSEIGLVTTDVKTTCENLIQDYGLQYFSYQPPSDQFSAIGDDQGLFIVVTGNRHWYPTYILSSRHWLKVEFENKGEKKVLEYPSL